MAVLLEQSSIQTLVSFKEVSVVQSIDVQALQKLLTSLSEGQAAAKAQIEHQQQEIDALKVDRQQHTHKHLQDGGSDAQMEAAASAAPGSNDSTSCAQPAAAAAAPHDASHDSSVCEIQKQKQLAELNQRMQQLEAQVAPASAVPSASGAAAEAPTSPAPAAHSSPATSAALSSLPHSTSMSKQQQQQQQAAADTAAGMQALQQQQALLASQLASLKAALAAATDECAQQLQDGLAGKADAAVLQGLLQGLNSKAEVRELDQVRQQLAGKADRAELDALLNSIAGVGIGSGGDEEKATASYGSNAGGSGGDGTSVAAGAGGGGEAVNAAQMSKLQLQLALLQERINSKADTTAVADTNQGLSAAQQELVQLQLSMQQMQVQLAADHTALADINKSHKQQSQQQQQNLAPASMHGQLSTPAQAGAGGINHDVAAQLQELPLLLLRLTAVEQSLAAAAAATQPGAAATAQGRSTSSNAHNGSSSSSNAVEPGGHGALFASLADQVASLQAQVSQLLHARAAARRSNSNPRFGTAPGGNNAQHSPQQALQVAAATESSSYAAAEGADADSDRADGAAPADAGDAAEDAAAGDASAGTLAALVELSERVVELQGHLDGLAAAKADRGELERMRGLLAETAAQNDVEMLRHKLNSQQQQLARLAQQLTGSSATADAGSGRIASGHSHSSSNVPAAADWDLRRAGAGAAARGSASVEASAAHMMRGADDIVGPAGMGPSLRQQQPAGYIENALERQHPDLGSADLQQQLQQQLAGLELLAEAVSLLATGQAAAAGAAAARMADPKDGNSSFSFATGGAAAAATTAAGTGSSGQEGIAGPGPQLLRLRRLLQTGQVGRKMDGFDPVLLQKMAQRLAATEALIKMQPHAGGAAGAAGTGGDVEGRLKRLAADVRMLKERLGDAAAVAAAANGSRSPGQGGWGMRGDGDHTMLAAKPLGGYRCMACDRPLGSLDASPGPHLPTGLMPVSLPNGAEMAAAAGAALGKLPAAAAGSRRTTMQEVGSVPPSARAGDQQNLSPASSPEPGVPARRLTGPQNWYAQTHGLPAEQLPKGDVGPHLPPGGWRGSLPRAEDGSVLPALVARGGGSVGVGPPGTAQGGR